MCKKAIDFNDKGAVLMEKEDARGWFQVFNFVGLRASRFGVFDVDDWAYLEMAGKVEPSGIFPN